MEFNKVTWYSKLAALILFIALPFIGFWIGTQYQQRVNPSSSTDSTINTATTSAKKDSVNLSINGVTAIRSEKVAFAAANRDGVLEYIATVQLPNSCTNLSHDVIVRESFPEQVQIDLTTKSTGETCAQVVTAKEVTGKIKASPQASVSVTLDGEEVK